jgi:toxin secretion/phage lysis holin
MGLIGAAIAASLGGWDMALQTLCIFMAIDYVSGLIVAGIFQASTKSENGALESRAGLKGLLRKAAMLCAVLMAYYLDQVAGTDFVRDAACLAFVCNEALSIIENFGLMGVPIPDAITNAIDVLKGKKMQSD